MKTNIEKISTEELISFLKSNRYITYNVELIVADVLTATHFIRLGRKYIYDNDIFDETIKWEERVFNNAYKGALWNIR